MKIMKIFPGLAVSVGIAAVACWIENLLPVHLIGGAVIAMFIGMIVNRFIGKNGVLAAGVKFTSKKILKFAIILLGLSLNINTILQVGKMSLAVNDVDGAIMLISNFTLCADCSHGRRPEFTSAAPAAKAEEYYNKLAALLGETNQVVCGVFGGDMRISAENFGPVTVYLDTASL